MNQPLTVDQFWEWIHFAPGWFSINDMARQYNFDSYHWNYYLRLCEKLVEGGELERHGARRGCYRIPKADLQELDFRNACNNPVDIWLPFELSDFVTLFPGNIFLVAAPPNTGKTALIYQMIHENMDRGWKQYLFDSESGAEELKERLLKFPDTAIEDWRFIAYQRAENFADVIKPGANCINYIDFLEVHDEFYMIGKKIKEVHDRLQGAIAVIAIQKNPGDSVKTGLGGYRTLEVARLAINMEHGKVKIVKAKHWRDPTKNPNGWERSFKLVQGYNIICKYGWMRESEQ